MICALTIDQSLNCHVDFVALRYNNAVQLSIGLHEETAKELKTFKTAVTLVC